MASPSPHFPNITDLVAAALHTPVRTSMSLGGGDVASSHRVVLADDRVVFAKTHADPPAHFFTTEATGLEWLRTTLSVSVPEVLHVSDEPPLLVLAWINEDGTPPDEETFGRELATLHSHSFETFGRPDGRTTGSLGLPNDPCDSWAGFLAERRLLPLARIAHDRASLPASAIATLESLTDQLFSIVPPPEPPSLLHGDLWAGNRIVDPDGRSWLIDPACFGGHREFDLAMMRLFGGYGQVAFNAYSEALPLAEGWNERVSLHQLPPLVVHAVKFGGSYVPAVQQALSRY